MAPVQIKPDATKEISRIAQPVAPALEHFDLVVEALDPSAGRATAVGSTRFWGLPRPFTKSPIVVLNTPVLESLNY